MKARVGALLVPVCLLDSGCTGRALTIVPTFGPGMVLMDLQPCTFDVGFDREARVRKVSEIYRAK